MNNTFMDKSMRNWAEYGPLVDLNVLRAWDRITTQWVNEMAYQRAPGCFGDWRATIRDRAGTKSLELDIPIDMTIQGLKDKLASDIPNLKDSMKSVLITINREYAFDEAIVPADAEIGMFPPVSGG